MFKGFGADKLSKNVVSDIVNRIQRKLGDDGVILVISLTGSRAFGWGNEKYDLDLHGVFYKEDYWDWVHSGEHALVDDWSYGYDISMYSLEHLVNMDFQYGHFEMLMNISNPIYRHRRFSIKKLWKMFPRCKIKYIKYDVLSQIGRFKTNVKNPRSALHAYRIMMIPIHFLRTGEIKHNVFELNEIHDDFKFTQLEYLAKSYVYREKTYDADVVISELDRLYATFLDEIKEYESMRCSDDYMMEVRRWYSKLLVRLRE